LVKRGDSESSLRFQNAHRFERHESTAHSTATVAVMACMFSPTADIVTGIVYVPGLTRLDEIDRNDSVLQRPPKTTMQ